jgi:hypothetical protein
MIPAAVGFQCPECVRLGSSSIHKTRTVFGGRVTANPHAATYALIGLNVLAFLGEVSSTSFVNRFWQYGATYSSGTQHATGGIADGQYYRLLTSMFLHEPPSVGGAFFLHILFNMWALFVVGPPLEALLGRIRFVALYLLTGAARCRASASVEHPAHCTDDRLELGSYLLDVGHQLAGSHRWPCCRRRARGGLGVRAASQSDGDSDRQLGSARRPASDHGHFTYAQSQRLSVIPTVDNGCG